ncbi:hypothetical protein F511_03415 [Dorcoceras hygrometricum]|uniref:Uncharacterized protein n=1 Tax=Dorcoceras hygrometricum TaxID=472368 RepID=A0A2Z7DJ94_9LAMI|nr:hypothetical protein F511_03415 [Dorcoceras hygrometricum]
MHRVAYLEFARLNWKAAWPGFKEFQRFYQGFLDQDIGQILSKSIIMEPGSGNISFWFDVWLLSCPLFRSWDITGPPDRLVDYFLTQEEWNWDRLLQAVQIQIAEMISVVPISPHTQTKWFGPHFFRSNQLGAATHSH